jgi:hypothetical protein
MTTKYVVVRLPADLWQEVKAAARIEAVRRNETLSASAYLAEVVRDALANYYKCEGIFDPQN